jgi:hypothetical protein
MTTIIERQLWFDSCPADSFIPLALFCFVTGGIFFAAWTWRRRGSARTQLMVLSGGWAVFLTIIFLVRPFPPEIVRLSVIDTRLEVRRCHVWSDQMQSYPVTDIEFRYEREERGWNKVVHHLLAMYRRGDPERLGSVEFLPRYRFDFGALRQLAPSALHQYELARQKTH